MAKMIAFDQEAQEAMRRGVRSWLAPLKLRWGHAVAT
jgi:hypothetical protein